MAAVIDVRRVDRSQAAIVNNLLEHYCHDMAEWFLLDAHEDGTYRYPPEKAWTPEGAVFLAYLDRIPIGFAIVGSAQAYVGNTAEAMSFARTRPGGNAAGGAAGLAEDAEPIGARSAHGGESPKETKDLKEFFVVRRHRRSGIGQTLAAYVWDRYPSPWLVRVYQGNAPALPFWRRVIGHYTRGRFAEEVREVDGRTWSYFRFDRP